MPKLLVLILSALIAAGTWWWLSRRALKRVDPVRTSLRRRLLLPPPGARGPSVQSVVDAAAAQMSGVVMVVERTGSELKTIACAPWGSELGPFDMLAAREVFDDGVPAGKGAGRHGMSDWLFVPVSSGAEVVAVAAVAGRNNRRSFRPDGDRNIAALVDALRTVLCPPRSFAPPPRFLITPDPTAAFPLQGRQ